MIQILKPLITITGSVLVLGIPTKANAQSSPLDQSCCDDANTETVTPISTIDDEIIVTATRRPTRRIEVGSTVSVIDRLDIEKRQFQFVADAISLAPGVNLARNSAFGGVSSVSLRGAGSGATLVLLDGIVINDPSTPDNTFNFANLDVADIAQIEVLRGPQSILYGSEAVGGVIAITTARSTSPFGLKGFIEGGSFATLRAGAGLHGQQGRFDYRASIFGITTDGISRADSADGNLERDGFDSIAGSANLGIEITPQIQLESFLRYGTSATEFDGFPPPDFTLADSDDDDSVEEITLGGRLIGNFLNDRFVNTVTIGYTDIERTNFSGDLVTFAGRGQRLSVEYLGHFTFHERLSITGGGETEETKIDTGDIIDDVRVNSVFGLAELKALNGPMGIFTLTAGARYDDHETFGGVTSARVTGAYALEDAGFVLRGSWGEGFSAPTLFQLNFVFGPGEPNMDLQPETSNGWDVGFSKTFLGTKGRLDATFFNQNIDNLIDFNFVTGAFFNINETRQRGVEAELVLEPTQSLRLTSAYTYTDAIDLATGIKAFNQPRHRLVSNIDWQISDRLLTTVAVTYNGEEVAFGGVTDNFTKVDLRAQYQLSNQVEVFARLENITDANYQDILGFGEPGISVFGGIRVNL